MKHDSHNEEDYPELSDIVEKVQDHVDTRLEYFRLLLSEKLAVSISKMVSMGIQAGLFLLFFLFLNIAAAIWVGRHYNDYVIGFGSVSALYLVFLVIYYALKRSLIERKMQDAVVKELFADNGEEDEDED